MNTNNIYKMEQRKIKITIETAQRWYGSNDEELKQLAVQTWPEVAEVKLPERWDDLKEIKGFFVMNTSDLRYVNHWQYDESNRNIFATKEQAEAALALAQLTQLAEVWCDKDGMWGVVTDKENQSQPVELMRWGYTNYVLRFDTKEKANRFIDLFEGLIIQASALIL